MNADILDIAAGVFLIFGAALSLSGSVALLRLPDVVARQHAATKPQVLGLILILIAVGLRVPSWGTASTLVLIALFQLLTIPVAAHMIGRAAYRTRSMRRELLLRDELADAVERAGGEER